uniref:Uncharacterized protein n=1 Tax=Arundo donax TaxID=35708 RepID=A0A0A9AG69_ARUDO
MNSHHHIQTSMQIKRPMYTKGILFHSNQ